MENNKRTKSYRMNKLVVEELQETIKHLNITETSFVEIAVIEKMAKLGAYSSEKEKINQIYKFIKKTQGKGI